MSAKRVLISSFHIAVLVSFLYPQSLAEIAQRERERRAKLKGRPTVVVTNADLAKMKKKPALEIPPAPPKPEPEKTEAPDVPEASPPIAAEAQESAITAAPPPRSEPLPDIKTLQQKWEKAREYVELLTLKMSALWQEFYALVDPGAKEAVQQAIAETFIKLQNAQEEEDRARRELEKLLQTQTTESTPSIWIR